LAGNSNSCRYPADERQQFLPTCQWEFRAQAIPLQILAAARIRVMTTPFSVQPAQSENLPLYAGQPISALLTIMTSFHWGMYERETQTYHMRFDIEEMVQDWLVSGRKRGDFIATVSILDDIRSKLVTILL